MVRCSVLEYALTYKEKNFAHSLRTRLLKINMLADAVLGKSLLLGLVTATFLLCPYVAQIRGIETSLLPYIIKALTLFVRTVYSML